MGTTQPVAIGPPAPPPELLALAAGIELVGPKRSAEGNACLIRRNDGRMVEVSPLVYAVAEAMYLHGDDVAVAQAVGARTGRMVTAENIRYLVEHKLRPLGLTADGSATLSSYRSPLGLTIRVGLIPERVVGALAGGLSWLFAAPIVAAILCVLAVVDIWLARQSVGVALADAVADPASALMVAFLTVLGATFHELGHAAASRYSGGRPGTIGIGIYILWPVFFNDLNDAYRLDRRGRLRCDLGGVYFNSVFAVALGLTYAVTGVDLLVLAAAVQHLAILQQFLPFVRLDGYYLVSDLAGVPDVFGYIRPVLRSLRPGHRAPELTRLQPGARRLVCAWVCTTVPALLVCSVLLVTRLPDLLAATWRMSLAQSAGVASAARAGDVSVAALGILHLCLVAVPFVGLSAAVVTALANCVRSRSAKRRPSEGAAPDDEPVHEWIAVVPATSDHELAAEDRWDAPDLASSLLRLDPADRWLPLPGR
ncbi:MAG: hypothetical protein ACLGI2_10665 [Acidimicrobiia bacterium]